LEAMKAYIDAQLQKKTKGETTFKTVVAAQDEPTTKVEENGDRENSPSYDLRMSD